MSTAIPPTAPSSVSARPSDNLGGTTTNVGSNPGDLQAAINAALPGDTLICPAGVTYPGRITLPARSDSNWICVRVANDATNLPVNQRVSPSNAPSMFRILSNGVTDDGVALDIPANTQGWRFIGMEMTHPNLNHQYGICNASGNRLSFERCYIHGQALAPDNIRAFLVNGGDFQIWDSWLSEWNSINTDAQSIFIQQNGPNHVENCELQGTGENIMLADQGSTAAATDCTLRRNHFFKPLRWRKTLTNGQLNPAWDGMNWGIKELFEIKRARRVLLEGNILENNWSGQGQDGTGSLASRDGSSPLNAGTQDCMYRSNTYINCPSMFSVQTVVNDATAGIIQRIAYLNNLGLNVGGWLCFFNHQSEDIWIEHNTVVPQDGVASIEPGSSNIKAFQWDATYDNLRQTIRRNVVGKSTYGLFDAGSGTFLSTARADVIAPDRDYAENAVYGPALDAVCAGFTSVGSAASVGLNVSDGTLAGNSSLKAGQPGYFGTDGKDIGVDFVALAAAQAGTTTIPTADFGFTQVSGTLTIDFVDTSLNGGSPITSWAWQFGDATNGNIQNPPHTYTAPNTSPGYTVTLTVTNANGSNTVSKVVPVNPIIPPPPPVTLAHGAVMVVGGAARF